MSDLVARLRDADTTRRIGESYADTHERRQRDRDEAADEIERLRAALEGIADIAHEGGLRDLDKHAALILIRKATLPYWKNRAALAEEKKG